MTTDTNTTIDLIKATAVADAKKRLGQRGPATTGGAIAAQNAVSKTVAKAKAKVKAKKATKAKTAKAAKPTARANSKQAQLIEMLRTAKGGSIEEIAKRFDWQHHTVRGAIAGALKRKLKLKVTATKDDKRGTVYRIAK